MIGGRRVSGSLEQFLFRVVWEAPVTSFASPARRFKVANDENRTAKASAASSSIHVVAQSVKASIVTSSTGAVRSALGELSNNVRRGVDGRLGKGKATGEAIEKPAAVVHRRTASAVAVGTQRTSIASSLSTITSRPSIRPAPARSASVGIVSSATKNASGAPVRPLPSRVRTLNTSNLVAAPKPADDVMEIEEVNDNGGDTELDEPKEAGMEVLEEANEDEIDEQEVHARVTRVESVQIVEQIAEPDEDDWTFASPATNARYQSAVEDIRATFKDEIDEFDMTMVSEYSQEIFEYMAKLEVESMANPTYMDGQTEIAWDMRKTLVDWLLQVHLRYHMLPETLWIAINIVDRFLSRRVVSLVKLQLVGVTAMFVASKYEEILAPSVEEFSFMTENTYSREEILKGEKIILQTLEHNVSSYCSPYTWVRRISKADDYDIQTRTLCKFLMEVTLLDYRFLCAKPSLIAAVGMYTSKRMLSGTWDEAFIFYSNFTEEQLVPGFHLLLENLAETDFDKGFVCKKYANKKFLKASLYARDWAHSTMRDRMQVHLHLATPLKPSSSEKTQNGKDFRPRTILEQRIHSAQGDRYDGVCLAITNDEWRKRWARLCLSLSGEKLDTAASTPEEVKQQQTAAELWRAGDSGFRRDEVNLTKLEEAESVIGLASEWLELDSPDEWVRLDSELALRQELAYASYLNLGTVILPAPRNREHIADYARAVSGCFNNTPPAVSAYLHLSVRIPVDGTSVCGPPSSSKTAGPSSSTGTEAATPEQGTTALDSSDMWEMWDVIRTHRPGIILSETDQSIHRTGGELAYQQYVRYLEKTSPIVTAQTTAGSVEAFAEGYWDYLQAPLQPLMDNLQSTTYEVFERDPVKYAKYEQAVYLALSAKPMESTIVICVAGAGRGPLVSGCLRAVTRSGRKAAIYAVEKNASAFVTLQERRDSEWGPLVQLVYGDMRTIAVPEKADILVSELLGSFGDNELSPECLDGAGRFLKDDGISIPSSYTAYMSPLSSSKLFNEARGMTSDTKSMETPYVVIFQAVNELAIDPQECWEFEHPRRGVVVDSNGLPYTNSHNTRSARRIFRIPHAGILHGLAGYFEARLYGDVGLSIHPRRKEDVSPNMLSWFPIFFPFKEPLYLPANSEVDISIWRVTDRRKVWYEWFAESFFRVPGFPQSSTSLVPPKAQPQMVPSIIEESNVLPPSPMVDAPPAIGDSRLSTKTQTVPTSQMQDTRVKIGQTGLQNPGGRSSWIGL
ncbi:methyltransferase protein [Tulasnella sp. 330]|nr:methyltransferase protein [Tulasnella sp. 330]